MFAILDPHMPIKYVKTTKNQNKDQCQPVTHQQLSFFSTRVEESEESEEESVGVGEEVAEASQEKVVAQTRTSCSRW